MAENVSATIQVAFGDADAAAAVGAHLSAAIDDRAGGLNGGDTAFAPGDTAYFLVWKSANVTCDTPRTSAGSIVGASPGVVQREQDVQFADTDEATLAVPATGIVSVTWLGRSLGSLQLQGEMTLKASAKGVAVARVTYNTAPSAHGLVSPLTLAGLTDFSILVYILGHVTG